MNFFHAKADFYSFADRSTDAYRLGRRITRFVVTGTETSLGGKIMTIFKHSARTGLGKRLVAVAAIAIACGNAWAAPAAPAYTMTVISDDAQGHKIVSGDYKQAIDTINASRSRFNQVSRTTNLCVAYTKSGELDMAAEACDAAILSIKNDNYSYGLADRVNLQSGAYRRSLAMALSNRGVLRAINGEVELAREDFLQALDLRAGIAAPSVNLARLEKDTTQLALVSK